MERKVLASVGSAVAPQCRGCRMDARQPDGGRALIVIGVGFVVTILGTHGTVQ